VAFRSAARAMYEEAQSHKEVLVKHGLSESVLVEFGKMLDEFDAAVRLGTEGQDDAHRCHAGAGSVD
jgi:hypothetical protein